MTNKKKKFNKILNAIRKERKNKKMAIRKHASDKKKKKNANVKCLGAFITKLLWFLIL